LRCIGRLAAQRGGDGIGPVLFGTDVRFTPDSDIDCVFRNICFGPEADSEAQQNNRRCPLPSAQKAYEVAELLHRRALYRVYAELRVLLTNLDGCLKCWGIECCLRLLKVFKSEQDYALG